MAKFLYLVEYVREDYITKLEDGTAQVNWLNSEEGSLFQEIVERVGLDIADFDIDFVYKKVPEPKKFGRDGQVLSYKDPKQVEVGPYQALITKKILENDYQLVIPTGKLGLYLTEGSTRAITRTRGSQEQVTVKPLNLSNKQVEEADDKVLQELEGLDETLEKPQWIYPVFSVSYVMTRVNNLRILMRDMETVKEVSDEGEDRLLPSETSYNLLDTMEDVRKVFTFLKENEGTITTAWDLETNTLKPEMEGSKVLLTSIAWSTEEGDEGNAVTIPLEKKETPFTKEEQQEILGYLKEFLESDTLKATANGKFDIRFMMMRYGFEEFNNVVDVQTAFYLTVTQEKTVSFSLSNLTYDYTDMGGYDNELDKFKKDYIADYRSEHGSKPVNDIDGGNFNYDWIPLGIMHPYASGDVDATLRIYWKLKKNVDSNEKWKYLFYEWYPQLDVALSRVEASGMYLDTDYLDVIDKEYEKEVYRLVDEMRELPSVKQLEEENKMYYEAGLKEMELKPAERNEEVAKLRNKYKGDKQKFNPNSPDHKARVLYDIMGAKLPENHLKDSAEGKDINEATWRDYSTDKKALKEMKNKEKYSDEINTMARLLEEYSSVKTLRNNFVVKYPRYISSKTGAIHANFNSLGTECVAGDTLIITDEGIQEIQDISGNREEGTFSDVDLNVATRTGVEEVGGFLYTGRRDGLRITLEDGTELTTTYNHPLLTQKGSEEIWKTAESLTLDDHVAVKYGTHLYGTDDYMGKMNLDPMRGGMDLARFLERSLEKYPEGELPSYYKNLYIPLSVMRASREVQERFIYGLTLSTTKTGSSQISFLSFSKRMMEQLRVMLLNMGIYCRLGQHERYSDIYQVSVDEENIRVFYDTIGFAGFDRHFDMYYLVEDYEEVKEVKDKTKFVRIARIDPVEDVDFFDLNVPGSHSFVGNGVVNHNTSRLSSSDPNHQNIPSSHSDTKKFDYAHPIKRLFISRFKNGAILEADYSGLEMRILGLVAKDKSMTQSFMDGVDFHKDTASLVFGKDIEDVTGDERQKSKAVSFGLVYGKGTGSLASDMGVTYKEAEEVVNKYYETKPAVKEFIEGTKRSLRKNGYVETLQGHRRQLQGIFGDQKAQADATRQSVNTIIQGTGAFLTNTSVILISEYLRKGNKKSKLIATVHDSVVLDVHPDEITELTKVVKHIMENLPLDFLSIEWEGKKLKYPIEADVELGSTYGDIHPYDPEEFHSFKSTRGFTEYKKLKGYVEDSYDSNYISKEEHDNLIEQVEQRKQYYQEMEE